MNDKDVDGGGVMLSRRKLLAGGMMVASSAALGMLSPWRSEASAGGGSHAALLPAPDTTLQRAVAALRARLSRNQKPTIVTTTAQIADVIAGVLPKDSVTVQALMSEGIDPHGYTPRRSDVQTLARADVIVHNGLHLEGMLLETLERMARRVPLLTATSMAARRPTAAAKIDPQDPHIWMDVTLWRAFAEEFSQMARQAYHGLANAGELEQRARSYGLALSDIDDYGRSISNTLARRHRVMITSHDAFRYFGRRYGFEVIGIQGISTADEPSLADIERVVSVILERAVPAVFFEASTNGNYVQAIAQGARHRGADDLRLAGPLYSDSMGAAGTWEGTYVGMMDYNFTHIVGALGGRVPAQGSSGMLRAIGGAHAT